MQNRILFIGGNSELGIISIKKCIDNQCAVGIHYSTNDQHIAQYNEDPNVKLIKKPLCDENDCEWVIDQYVKWANGIDCLVVLIGGIHRACYWEELKQEDMQRDYLINTVFPFMMAKAACSHMKELGGRIVFVSTASAKRGGGSNSLGYGMAKYAIECMTKRLAKDLARYSISVNAIAPGFFDTELHKKKFNRTPEELAERSLLVPLKRAGSNQEFGALLNYLLSEDAGFVTGQVITIDGGDFI